MRLAQRDDRFRVGVSDSKGGERLAQEEFDDKNLHNAVAEENLKWGRFVLADAKKHLRMLEKCLKFDEEDNKRSEEEKGEDGVTV